VSIVGVDRLPFVNRANSTNACHAASLGVWYPPIIFPKLEATKGVQAHLHSGATNLPDTRGKHTTERRRRQTVEETSTRGLTKDALGQVVAEPPTDAPPERHGRLQGEEDGY
jgi:hypothetical protein